jgi:hypothetical protein
MLRDGSLPENSDNAAHAVQRPQLR